MAAKDNESVQTFPQAVFDIPPKDHVEEAVVLALNVQDGQQSLGQSVGDPYTRAVRYLEKHHIVEIFQVSVTMATQGFAGPSFYVVIFNHHTEFDVKNSL